MPCKPMAGWISAPPQPGAHTDAMLAETGCNDDKIVTRRRGAASLALAPRGRGNQPPSARFATLARYPAAAGRIASLKS